MKDLARVLLIVANAGSGKTYRLVTRCLELIARGEAPDRILALTFTRKAAAEFLQKLFGRLAEAARDPDALQRLRNELGDPKLTAAQCNGWLRHLTTALPRLSMGTMDGFFGRIARSFPFELGLGREFRLLDEAGLEEHRQIALDRLFAAAAEAKGGLDQLVELLRQESRNRSDRSVLRTIESAAQSLQQSYLETPPRISWGDPDLIWPEGNGILSAGSVEDAVQTFRDEIAATHHELGRKARDQWDAWFALALAHRAPRRMNGELEKFLAEKLSGGSKDNKTGELYIPVGNKSEDRLYLRGRLLELRENLRRALVKLEIEAKIDSSRALHTLLARYESIYDVSVRETGALTFSDIALFLAASSCEPWRRDLDYRLDGRHDHWLLDEFQDTSRTQWRILEPLADEIIQDTADARTFFYVGDTKQAIYGWRGGDARLFWEIRDRYNRGKTNVIEKEELEISHRSSRAIVHVVEAVLNPRTLGNHGAEFRFPAATVPQWQQAWVAHRASDRAIEGYARLESVEPSEEETSGDAITREVLRILRETEPLARGLDCVILVRTNDELARYISMLKEAGIPAAAEGKINPCLATPSGRSLLSLIRAIASPVDRRAQAHAEASPWREVIGPDFSTFAAQARHCAAATGFAPTLRGWIRRGRDHGVLAPHELEAFAAAAAVFDAARSRAGDWSGLARAIEHRTTEESETPGAIRVMTIHQAKGLGVDMVILPELGGKALSEFRDDGGILLHRNALGEVQWGLSLPRKDLCQADPVLAAAREEARARQTYEALCVLYVGMTRAKKALYCVTARGRNDKNTGKWLEKTFPGDGDRREQGDPRWFETFSRQSPPTARVAISSQPLLARGKKSASTPSRQHGRHPDSIIGGVAARQLGTEVHRLLAKIDWLTDQSPIVEVDSSAADLVRHFLAGQVARNIFTHGSSEPMLWREQTFDLVLDDEHFTGTFDRVHIMTENGRPQRASIYDFKTENATVEELGRRYAGQLEIYRRAAAKLLGLPVEHVEAQAIPVASSS